MNSQILQTAFRNARFAIVLASLIMTVRDSTFGDEPIAQQESAAKIDKSEAELKTNDKSERSVAADAPKDETKKEQPDKKVDAKKVPAEVLNIEVLAEPLRLLFGGVRVEAQAIPVENVPEVEGENDALTQQYIQQLRPMLIGELMFIRLICSDLLPEHRPKIRAAGETGLKTAAKQMAALQNRQNRGMGGQGMTQPEPRKTIHDGIAKVLKETLTEPQMLHYQQEANDRAAVRKQAAILCAISQLDSALYLTTEQRDKIITSISTNWQDKWENWLMLSMYGGQYYPTIPDQNVTPHLSKEQKSVWQGLQKIEFGGWWGGEQGQDMLDNDGWWGNEAQNNANAAAKRVPVRRARVMIGF